MLNIDEIFQDFDEEEFNNIFIVKDLFYKSGIDELINILHVLKDGD